MIVHPAFTFGDEEIEGFWTAKFEASMAEENTNTVANNNVVNKTVKIVPNVNSWRYIQEGNAFKTCLKMKEEIKYKLSKKSDTHQMKNNEWGAIAYLSASQYGNIPTKNNSGTSQEGKYYVYIAGGDYITNINQSTTGNITGIYDLNGGAWEYVAAYWNNKGSGLEETGTEEIFYDGKLNKEYEKYFDKYEVGDLEKEEGEKIWNMLSTEGNKKLYELANERINLMKYIKGDAMYEAINEWSYWGRYGEVYTVNDVKYNPYEFTTWLKPIINEDGELTDTGETKVLQYGRGLYGNDYTLIGTYIYSFIRRGGDWGDDNASGIFSSCGSYGSSGYVAGFRPTIII